MGGYFARKAAIAASREACARGIRLAAPGRRCEEVSATGPALPLPGVVRSYLRRAAATAARRRFGRARDLAHNPAGLRIVLAHRVLTDVDKAPAIDRHSVPLRRIEGTDHVAGLIDMDHRRRSHAAIGQRRIQLGLKLDIGEVVRPVQDPDVVVFVDGEAGHATHLPFVRKRFGPVRIEPESGRGLRLRIHRQQAYGHPSGEQATVHEPSTECPDYMPVAAFPVRLRVASQD